MPPDLDSTPAHLKHLIAPGALITENELEASVQCPCKSSVFRLFHAGYTVTDSDGTESPCQTEVDGKWYYIVSAQCVSCRGIHVLLDEDFHGWNGLVSRYSEAESKPRPPLVVWPCAACGEEGHELKLKICNHGKDDFTEECGGEVDESEWVNGFSCFGLDIRCHASGNTKEDWGNKETM